MSNKNSKIINFEKSISGYSGAHVDEGQSSGFSGIGDGELGKGKTLQMYLTLYENRCNSPY
jgi:hypothetical protein